MFITLFVVDLCYIDEKKTVWQSKLNFSSTVRGIAHLMSKIYVIIFENDTIFVYDDRNLQHQKDILLKGRLAKFEDIVASPSSRCLYVSDSFNECVWKICDVVKGQQMKRWLSTSDKDYTWTMSVAFDGSLFMLQSKPATLDIYGSDACLIQSITLPWSGFPLHHIVQDISGSFIVSHETRDKEYIGVCMISTNGQIIQSCRIPPNKNYAKRVTLSRLAVDDESYVYVYDCDNDVIWCLNSMLGQWKVMLFTNDDGDFIEIPQRICFVKLDDTSKLLISCNSEINVYSMHEEH